MTRKISGLLFAVVFVVLFAHVDVLAGNKIRATKAFGRNYVYLRDVARYYGMNIYIGRSHAELYSKYSRIIFTYDKKKGLLNGQVVYYAHAPFRSGNEAFVSEHDFSLLIDPILRYRALPKHQMKTIVIDPGHGAHDSGGVGSKYKEKDLVLKISLKLRDILKQKGYYVIMTRSSDKFLELADRPAVAAKYKADLFISVHGNIAGAKTVSGIETYCLTPNGAPSTKDTKPVYKAEKGNSWDRNNARLAYEIQSSLVRRTKATDRGVKRARFAVLKDAPCPAVLLELGFLSNATEEKKLATASYQQTLAIGIANGIIRYHRELARK